MKLFDYDSEKNYGLIELKKEYLQFYTEDKHNHCDNFKTEFFEILLATINGRNNLEIIGLTAKETSNYILKLRKQIIN